MTTLDRFFSSMPDTTAASATTIATILESSVREYEHERIAPSRR